MAIRFTDPQDLSHAALEEGDLFAPRFDAQGLVTAITIEASSGALLMVAHMNATDCLRATGSPKASRSLT